MPRLDHLFVCTQPDPPEAQALRDLGFRVEFSREHPGQGTANRLLLFPDEYLELLFLADRAEAEANMVRLDRRVDWEQTGASPFGIAMRGPRGEGPWVSYTLPGFPSGLWIDGRTLDDPRLPLVFVFDNEELTKGGPSTHGYPPALLEHPCGADGIVEAVISGPGLSAAPWLPLPDNVRLEEGPVEMRLRLRGEGVPPGRVSPTLVLE